MYSSKLSVGVHILCLLALSECPVTSETLAGSIGTNPALVRRLMSSLKRAQLLDAHPRLGATGLAKPPEKISLLDIFRAVEPEQRLFDVHTGMNPRCPVGAHIGAVLAQLYDGLQQQTEAALGRVKLSELIRRLPPAAGDEKAERPDTGGFAG